MSDGGGSRRRVLITGAHGMIGFHLRCRLHVTDGIEVLPVGRAEFDDADTLSRLVGEADAVVHLAGLNRGPDQEIEEGNPRLAEALIRALRHSGAAPSLFYSSSTHAERDTPYGRSKRLAGERLRAWAESAGAAYRELVLPHVFGETGRPHYNSVVHTFCHQLAGDEAPSVADPSGRLELLHAGDLAQRLAELLRPGAVRGIEQLRVPGRPMTVGELAELLGRQHEEYFVRREIPELTDRLELALFNCLRGAAFPQRYPVALDLHEDPRGSLFEAVRARRTGQTFFSTTRPGITRGNHFHFSKVERFLVVGGRGRIRLRRLFDDAVQVFEVDGARPSYVDMPTLHTHEITNVGDGELLTLFWAHEFFDPERPDTHAEAVDLPENATAAR